MTHLKVPKFGKINCRTPSVNLCKMTFLPFQVRKEDGMYAFFMEAAVIEYHIERKCDLTMIGGLLDSKGYGIALPPSKFKRDHQKMTSKINCILI